MADREVNGCAVAIAGKSEQRTDRKKMKDDVMGLSFIVFFLSATAFGVPKVGALPTKAETPSAVF